MRGLSVSWAVISDSQSEVEPVGARELKPVLNPTIRHG